MSSGPQDPALHVFADLHVDVDGVPVQVHGDGSELVVETDHPVRLARAALRDLPAGDSGSRALAARAGDLLAAEGVSVSLHGPRGRIATVGGGADSSVAAALLGTRRVSVAARSLVPMIVTVAATSAVAVVTVRSLRRSRG